MADELDPSYAAIMQDRINQFTDYQWKVHLVMIHFLEDYLIIMGAVYIVLAAF